MNEHKPSADRNGLIEYLSRYLNVLGNWYTYRRIDSPEQLLARLAGLTETYFGLTGLERGRLRPGGLLAVMLLVHALEQASGALATLSLRLWVRAEIVGRHRGRLIYRSPFTPRTAWLADRLTGGRLAGAEGFYFSEAGRTWHSQSLTVRWGRPERTLTQIRSLSLPHREFYFDRTLAPAQAVELVLAPGRAETMAGYLGAINELEDLSLILGQVKRLLVALSWLLVEPGERDEGGGRPVDYGPFGGARPGAGRPPPSGGGSLSPARRKAPPADEALFGGRSAASGRSAVSRPSFRSKPFPIIQLNGREYPLRIERVEVSLQEPGRRLAVAAFFDGQQWQPVEGVETRAALAQAVAAGLLPVESVGA